MNKTKPVCGYCGRTATLIKGSKLYPHKENIKNSFYWICYSCIAYVGCHKRTTNPLGNLANTNLRRYKARAHVYFDPLWRSNFMTRTEAYKKLAVKLNIPVDKCHFGLFTEDQCQIAIDWAIEIMPDKLRLEIMFEGTRMNK